MNLSSPRTLFLSELRDLYSAETQLLDALPKMAQAATNAELRAAFQEHLEETRGQVERLQRIFDSLGENPKGEHCDAMAGLIKEGEEVIQAQGDADVKDAALIAAAQRVEHYEIAGYGTVSTFADLLDLDKEKRLLQEILDEEAAADKKLTKIATGGLFTSGINKEALETT